jgi:hypothetical protein
MCEALVISRYSCSQCYIAVEGAGQESVDVGATFFGVSDAEIFGTSVFVEDLIGKSLPMDVGM